MDKAIEEKFVKNFIMKEKRERILYELFSPEKREQVIHRLYQALDKKYKILEDDKIRDEELFSFVKRLYDVNKNCYVIADSVDDGTLLPFKVAFEHMVADCADYAILCGENTVIMKEEFYSGSAFKIVLHKKDKTLSVFS